MTTAVSKNPAFLGCRPGNVVRASGDTIRSLQRKGRRYKIQLRGWMLDMQLTRTRGNRRQDAVAVPPSPARLGT